MGEIMYNNGFFDLNFLFENFCHSNGDDFFKQPYIELEVIGKRKKFWFTIEDDKGKQKFLYKKTDSRDLYEAYGEVLAEEIAILLGIPCAKYMLAKFNYEDENIHDFKNSYGIITPTFLLPNERLIPIGEIISTVYHQKIKNNPDMQTLYDVEGIEEGIAINRMNNLEDIWSVLDCYFKDWPNKDIIVKQLMEHFVKLYLYDVITLQGDRHIWNFGVIINKETKAVRPAPIYDNSNILNLNRPKISSFLNILDSKNILSTKKLALQKEMVYNMLYHSKLLFSANTEDFLSRKAFDRKAKQLDSLKDFLNKSDSETKQLLDKYISILDEYGITNIIKNYEKNTGHKFPSDFTEYFNKSLELNLENIKETMNQIRVSNHNRR